MTRSRSSTTPSIFRGVRRRRALAGGAGGARRTTGSAAVGIVGRINPRKDLETFVRAAALVAERVPEARFVVVGAADLELEKTYLEVLVRLVRELGLTERLTFAGARRDIPAVMRALDVFVLTSRHEGFGRVVAEAMAAGVRWSSPTRGRCRSWWPGDVTA